MFDWPEASQTSPTSTSSMTMALRSPRTVNIAGVALAWRRSSSTCQRPVSPARMRLDCAPIVTLTSSPGAAQPHSGTLAARCSTM